MLTTTRAAALALCLLIPWQRAHAEMGWIIQQVPRGADNAVIIAIVRQALINHHWTIASVSATSIVTILDGQNTDVRMTIYLSGDQLLYEGHAMRMLPTSGIQSPPTSAPIPRRWLNILRADIGAALSTLPDRKLASGSQ